MVQQHDAPRHPRTAASPSLGFRTAGAAPADPAPGRRLLGLACAVAVVLLFASFTLVSRLGFAGHMGIGELGAIRFGVGGALMLPLFLRYGLAGLGLARALVLALLGGLGFALLAYGGFLLAPASHGAVLLHGMLPLFSFALGVFVGGQRLGGRQQAGLALLALGLGGMAADTLSASSPPQWLGDAALLLASASWSTYGFLVQRWRVNPARAAASVAVLSAALYFPFWLLLGPAPQFPPPGPGLALQVVVQGVLLGAASVFVYSQAVALLGATQIALWTAAVPAVTTFAAIPLLGEWPSAAALAAVGVATAGLMLAAWRSGAAAAAATNPPSRSTP